MLNWVNLRGLANLECALTFGSALINSNAICARWYNVTSQSTCQVLEPTLVWCTLASQGIKIYLIHRCSGLFVYDFAYTKEEVDHEKQN